MSMLRDRLSNEQGKGAPWTTFLSYCVKECIVKAIKVKPIQGIISLNFENSLATKDAAQEMPNSQWFDRPMLSIINPVFLPKTQFST